MPQTTLNVSLTPQLNSFIKAKVKSGRYQSASEVIREGLRLLERDDRQRAQAVRDIRGKIAEGWQQLQDGETVSGSKVFSELRKLSRQQRAGKSA